MHVHENSCVIIIESCRVLQRANGVPSGTIERTILLFTLFAGIFGLWRTFIMMNIQFAKLI